MTSPEPFDSYPVRGHTIPPLPASAGPETCKMREMGNKPIRQVELRSGEALDILNLNLAINYEAVLVQATGMVYGNDDECDHCVAGYGPFVQCVARLGLFKGTCANCHYVSMGQCSHRGEYHDPWDYRIITNMARYSGKHDTGCGQRR
ncbi:hypothetical protein BDV59DRAFT_170130 [Aspergillus ambiguus]|uniref:DUF3716 domain-containing protein n=1 Tax=Aspergillus ambiguus TaxID=176160 RepID=UPI003CCD0589